jgi:ribulose-5-phosphate 4-epimerase/fuculose-1-phosphate aldolase
MDLIEDLIAAYRILAAHDVIDAYGHVSVRSEKNPNRYFLAGHIAPELVEEKHIIEYDLDSNAIDARGRESVRERFIHGEIYKTRPEVNSVVHNHSPSVVPFSITTVALRPIYHMAAFVGAGIPNWEIRDAEKGTDMLVKTPHLGQSLAKTLGEHPVALLRGHGAVVVGETIARSVGRSIYLEQSARMQMQAMLLAGPGAALTCFDESEVQASMSAQNYNRAWPMWRAQALAKLRSKPLTDFLPQWPVK